MPPGAVAAAAPLALPIGVLLELLPGALASGDGVEDMDGVDGVDGVVTAGDEGVAPVSSTFLPQAPNASKAARATAVAAAGLNLDASMSVSFYKSDER